MSEYFLTEATIEASLFFVEYVAWLQLTVFDDDFASCGTSVKYTDLSEGLDRLFGMYPDRVSEESKLVFVIR